MPRASLRDARPDIQQQASAAGGRWHGRPPPADLGRHADRARARLEARTAFKNCSICWRSVARHSLETCGVRAVRVAIAGQRPLPAGWAPRLTHTLFTWV
jgi:hypothetical protein